MKTDKIIARVLIIVMTLTILSSNVVMAEGKVFKEETVYVNLNNKGEELGKISSIWIHSDTPLETVEDKSELKDIINIKGDEVPIIEDGKLIWETDKKDIYYQGKADKSLPIQPEIKYYLDGKKVDVEDIVGETGDIKITIDINNKDIRNGVYTPYMVATVVNLPGGRALAETLNEALKEQKTALEGIKNSSDELVLALTQLEEGLIEAEEASVELSQGIENINVGQQKINSGLNELATGTKGLKVVSKQLIEGSSALQEGANNLNENALIAKEGTTQFIEGSKGLAKGTEDLTNGLRELNKGAGNLHDGISELSKGTDELVQGGEKLKEGSHKLTEGAKELNEGMHQFHQEGIKKMDDELGGSDLNITDIIENKDKLVKISKSNTSFTGIGEDMDGSLKFIMKTEGIKGEEKQEKVEIEPEQTALPMIFLSNESSRLKVVSADPRNR
ncbi:hypothetical protein [Schnuerera sp.]|uniref:hypothetical protein n=1 Tax=Schnuerera sp. TaxID=2794844 RepID=UPI002CB06037|nr:hypothetical protein [Schnuerera sp.]HSH35764.1 hypothetical protein [Schnuerera sp.]